MSDKKLKIGIVGCGNISDIHAQAIVESDNNELVSAFSRTDKNLKKITDKYDISGFNNYNDFLNDKNLDAVSICTPSGTHLDYAKNAAEAGKHVIIEKPIEVTLERARGIIELCKANKVRLAVIYQNRFIDDVMKMKSAIDNGMIGKVFMADAYIKWYRSQEYYDSGAWRGTLHLDGGGVLINQAIHTIDLLYWFAGDVEELSADIGTFTHDNIEGEDNAVASLKFASGAIGVIQGSTSIIPAFKRKIEIHGDKGTAVLEGDKFRILKTDSDIGVDEDGSSNTGGSSPLAGFSIEPHKKQFEQIAGAVLNDKTTVVSGEESLKSLAIVKGIYESAERRKFINLKEFANK